jgi:hypothetical protein
MHEIEKKFAYGFGAKTLKRLLGRQMHEMDDNTEWILEKSEGRTCTGFVRVRTRTPCIMLRIYEQTFGFHKMRGIY